MSVCARCGVEAHFCGGLSPEGGEWRCEECMDNPETLYRTCDETGRSIYKDKGNFVKNFICWMGYWSKYDLEVYEFYIKDGWYSYEYLDYLIKTGEARRIARYWPMSSRTEPLEEKREYDLDLGGWTEDSPDYKKAS